MDESPIKMFYPKLKSGNKGTSFSAPKITRFAAHLLDSGLSPQQIKANIIGSSIRETQGRKSSGFGWVNFLEVHSLNGRITLEDNKPWYMPFKYPKNTETIHISSSALTTNHPIFGEEYNLMNVEISLVGYKDYLAQPEQEKDGKKTVVESPKTSTYKKIEQYKRFADGKYFTSKKKDYKLKDVQELEQQGYILALRIRKLNLYDVINEEDLKVSFCIKIKGDFSIDDLKLVNEQLIEVETTVEIGV